MSTSAFVEDIFIDFIDNEPVWALDIDDKDMKILDSFYITLTRGRQLTKLQGELMLRLMRKYRHLVRNPNPEHDKCLETPQWKQEFRIIDTSTSAKVEKNNEGAIELILRFPYQLKDKFDKTFAPLGQRKHRWDPERAANIMSIYDVNIVAMHEFLLEHRFNIDDSFIEVLAQVEEIWNDESAVVPFSAVEHDTVVLKNVGEDADRFWQENRKFNLEYDMLLAHTMGYQLKLDRPANGIFEKIAETNNNAFWAKDITTFFKIHTAAKGVSVIMLDREPNAVDWLENFVEKADQADISRSDIKVCFRDGKNEGTKVNDWIKAHGVGGNVDQGKIFIFRHKPAKWLFTNKISVKLIATNSLFPMTNMVAQKWIEASPCVLYVSDIKATQIKGKPLVEL
jgi:hypothetical protein